MMTSTEGRKLQVSLEFEQTVLLRRLSDLGVKPIMTHVNLVDFYWNLLRHVEGGGN